MSMHDEFGIQVLQKGAEFCLPGNLSQKWLNHLTELTNIYLEDPDSDDYVELVSATVLILMFKASTDAQNEDLETKIEISLSEMGSALGQYCHEIALEELHRAGLLNYNPADLSNIFENRDREISNLK